MKPRDERDSRETTPLKAATSHALVRLVPSALKGFIPPHGGYETLHSYLGLIKVTNCLLDQQIRALEKALIQNGGMREAMSRARLAYRGKGQRGPKT